jgi:hypothetical protein
MSRYRRIVILAVAGAITGVALLAVSYGASLAVPWFASLTDMEQGAFRIACLAVTILSLIAVGIARSRARDEEDAS